MRLSEAGAPPMRKLGENRGARTGDLNIFRPPQNRG